jgi:hypothetical protein
MIPQNDAGLYDVAMPQAVANARLSLTLTLIRRKVGSVVQ